MVLPASLTTAHFFSDKERAYAVARLSEETADELRAGFVPKPEEDEVLEFSEVLRGIFNIGVWLTGLAYFAMLAGLYSFSLFVCSIVLYRLKLTYQVPIIINNMGIAKSPNEAQLFTVVPYVVATPVTSMCSWYHFI
jgi:hypothetical protein